MPNCIKTSFCFVCLANLENNLFNKSTIAKDINDHEHIKRKSEICSNFCYLSSKLIHLEETTFKRGLLPPHSNDERQLICCDQCLPRLQKFCETYESLLQILDEVSSKMKEVSATAAKECPEFTLKTLEKMDICQLQKTFIEKAAKRRATWKIPMTVEPVANNLDSMRILKIEKVVPPQEDFPVDDDHFLNYAQSCDTVKSEQVGELEVPESVEPISEAENSDEQPEASSGSKDVFDIDTDKVKVRKKRAVSNKLKDNWKPVSISEEDLAKNWRLRITHVKKSSKLTLYRCAYSRGSTPCVAKLRRRELQNPIGNGVIVEFECNSNSLDHSSHSGFINQNKKCLLCPKINSSQFELERHMRTHSKEKPFHCRICGNEYTEKKSLTNHEALTKHYNSKTSVRKKTLICNICGKKFATQHNLKTHVHAHSDSRNFQCDICEKGFKQLYNLKYHKRQVHRSASADKPYQCDICGLKFDYSNNLKWHRRQYHDDDEEGARFKCPYEPCPKTFCQKSWLQRHIKLHSGERPFQCDQCGYAFKEKGGLKRHMKDHLGLSSFLCRICGKVFKRGYSLRRHEQKHTVQEDRG